MVILHLEVLNIARHCHFVVLDPGLNPEKEEEVVDKELAEEHKSQKADLKK
ncbi:MAG: hypothetical protein AAF716_12545 [Cyanobacteria bacterium P01_D01_bin.1]